MSADPRRPAAACTIRKAVSGDFDRVREIFQDSPEAGALAQNSWEESCGWTGSLVLVSESQGQVTGFLLGREIADEAEIFNLAVASHYRRQGHGATLVASALGGMRSRGIQRVFLEVRESNHGAIAFYENLGFLKNGRRKDYYHHPDEAAITMQKKLTG